MCKMKWMRYIYIYIKYANRSYIQNIGPEFVSEDVI